MFAIYAAGLSAFETFAYGMFALGALLRPGKFPLGSEKEKRRVDFGPTADRFSKTFPTEAVTAELTRVSTSSDFRDWNNIRNVLSHRGSPGRQIHVQVGQGPTGRGDRPADWMGNPLTEGSISAAEKWLMGELAQLVEAADDFVGRAF